MCNGVSVSSTASSGSGHQGPRGKRSKKDISPEQPEVHESESVLEVPQEMTQMLQTFTCKSLLFMLYWYTYSPTSK